MSSIEERMASIFEQSATISSTGHVDGSISVWSHASSIIETVLLKPTAFNAAPVVSAHCLTNGNNFLAQTDAQKLVDSISLVDVAEHSSASEITSA
jgi:hypothetical protein